MITNILVHLGDRVKDPITGVNGIAVGRTEWLYGCVRVSVQPEGLTKDGKAFEQLGFDEPQLEVIKRGAVKRNEYPAQKPGGPRDEPSRRADVTR